MNKDDLKMKVYQYIKENPRCSFAELESQVFDKNKYAYQGYSTMMKSENVFIWAGWTEEAFSLIQELHDDNIIHFYPASFVEILLFGKGFAFSIAIKPNHNYKSTRWLPVTMSAGRISPKYQAKITTTTGSSRRK